jgi:hypothetical protein
MVAPAAQENANEIHSKSMFFMDFPSGFYRANYTWEKNNRVGRMIVETDVIEIALPCTDAYLDVRAARNFGRRMR